MNETIGSNTTTAGVVGPERERNWLWRMKDNFRIARPVQGRINVKAHEVATTLDLRSWAKVLPEIIDRHGALDPEELRYLIKTLRENAARNRAAAEKQLALAQRYDCVDRRRASSRQPLHRPSAAPGRCDRGR
jgi:hypothetical protein